MHGTYNVKSSESSVSSRREYGIGQMENE
jgi:hypothetical protein